MPCGHRALQGGVPSCPLPAARVDIRARRQQHPDNVRVSPLCGRVERRAVAVHASQGVDVDGAQLQQALDDRGVATAAGALKGGVPLVPGRRGIRVRPVPQEELHDGEVTAPRGGLDGGAPGRGRRRGVDVGAEPQQTLGEIRVPSVAGCLERRPSVVPRDYDARRRRPGRSLVSIAIRRRHHLIHPGSGGQQHVDDPVVAVAARNLQRVSLKVVASGKVHVGAGVEQQPHGRLVALHAGGLQRRLAVVPARRVVGGRRALGEDAPHLGDVAGAGRQLQRCPAKLVRVGRDEARVPGRAQRRQGSGGLRHDGELLCGPRSAAGGMESEAQCRSGWN